MNEILLDESTSILVRDLIKIIPSDQRVKLVIGTHVTNVMEAAALGVSIYTSYRVYKIEAMIENVGLSRNCIVYYITIDKF